MIFYNDLKIGTKLLAKIFTDQKIYTLGIIENINDNSASINWEANGSSVVFSKYTIETYLSNKTYSVVN